eukprot:1151106-Pelagomonas_calceolata.AAC.2
MQPRAKKGQKPYLTWAAQSFSSRQGRQGQGQGRGRARASKLMELSEDTTESTDEKKEEGDE